MFKDIASVFSFLTVIPVSNSNLETIAKYMYIFPLVGIVLGLIVGSIGFGLSLFLDSLIVSLFVVVSVVVITGMHHTDGLADFADGLMVKGTKAKKIAAMKDLSTGTAGTTAIVLYLIGLVVLISQFTGYQLFLAIVLSEIFAKFSMVMMAYSGKSASLGSNSPFVELMKNKKKMMLAIAITLTSLVAFGGTTGLLVFTVGSAFVLFLVFLTARSFGGITGDVLGATNELTRFTSLLIFVLV